MNDAAAIASGSWLQEVLANANHGTDGMGTDAGKLAKVGKGKDRGRGRGKH
jgi:hypothetical protein